jgi:hypothetical protein
VLAREVAQRKRSLEARDPAPDDHGLESARALDPVK